jgi:hypothetical protein
MNFFIGQRVRVVSAGVMPEMLGREAVVTTRPFTERGWLLYGISIDGVDTYSARPSSLEPILPSGHQPAAVDVHELLPFLREKVV